MPATLDFAQLTSIFDANLRAIATFCEQTGGMADDFDRQTALQYVRAFAAGHGHDPADMERELLGDVNDDIEIDDRLVQIDDEEFSLQIAEQKSSIKITEFIAWLKAEQRESAGLLQVLDWLRQRPPVHGELLRRGVLVTLVSQLELLYAEIVGHTTPCPPKASRPTNR